MKYLDLKNKLGNFVLFSSSDILKADPEFHPQRLSEWQRRGYIKKITNNYYTFSDTKIDEKILFVIANKIYSPSYVSMETALSYYGIIPESVYTITSTTTRRTRGLKSGIGQFEYLSVQPKIFFGYRLESSEISSFKIAEPEKAILDFLNTRTDIDNQSELEEMRFNLEIIWEIVDAKKLLNYLKVFDNKALEQRVNKFLKFIKNA